ncbi:MAG: TonB-dependent receptor domain-containing protein, partial [Longimicrobiales bacterium]
LNFTPSANFRQRLNLGWDWSQSTTIEFDPFGYWDFPDGSRTNDNEITRMLTVDYAGSWFANLTSDWTSTFEWGGQYNDREERGLRIDCDNFTVPGLRVLNECEEETANLQEDRRGFKNGGFFVQERFGWKDRLFLTAGVRSDAFSQINRELGLDFDFLTYPHAQLAYTLSDHDFWPDWWETLRFRAAWGESGDPPPQSGKQTLWQIAGADEISSSGLIIQTIATDDIESERTSEWEGGIDASFFNGRVSLQGTGFYRTTTDGILNTPLLPSGGILESPPINIGAWKTWGFEAAWDVAVLETSRSRLSLNGSFEWSDNEITDLGDRGQGAPGSPQSVNTDFNQRFTEGQSFPQHFGEPVMNPDELALPVRDTTQNLGRSIPNRNLSLGVSFTYDRLTLDVFGSGQFGHLVLDEQAEEAATEGVWPQCVGVDDNLLDHVNNGAPLEFTAGEIARCSSFTSVGGVDLNNQNEDWLFSGDYFRVQSASLSYRLPETWLPRGLSGAQVQFRATNLALIGGLPTGTDPDALNGASVFELSRSNGFALPVPRTYAINVQVNF